MSKPIALLGGLTAEQFLSEYWQKKPLLVRGALTDVGPHADFAVLSELATREDVESRLIEFKGGQLQLEHGPFKKNRFKRLPAGDWTILVQSANHHLPHVADILWQFDFLPYARLDDLMISYAPPGGTVGPHFDSYDVFLLQVGGKKRWMISGQEDVSLIEGAPLRILQHFEADETFDLEHGDMLYLPPKYAHYGVATEPGMTYSIGFRAPAADELANQFLMYLQDHVCAEGRYADPDLKAQSDPALISTEMVQQVSQILQAVRWDESIVADFLGHYLTEPKAHVFYDAPESPLDEDAFVAAVTEKGVTLDLKSQILFVHDRMYCNGEALEVEAGEWDIWKKFANQRRLAASNYSQTTLDALFDGYLSGYWQVSR